MYFASEKKCVMVLICFWILIAAGSCDDNSDLKPVANFSIRKLYHAGDTIFLNDSSKNAYAWRWLLPNDSVVTTKNAMFIISPDAHYSQQDIKLVVDSKSRQLHDSLSIRFNVMPAGDFFVDSNNSPLYTETYGANDSVGVLYAQCWTYTGPSHKDVSTYIQISFPTQKLISGTYLLSDQASPSLGYASIYSTHPQQEAFTCLSSSGQLSVIATNNSMIITFDNVPTTSGIVGTPLQPAGIKLSGHFTVPK